MQPQAGNNVSQDRSMQPMRKALSSVRPAAVTGHSDHQGLECAATTEASCPTPHPAHRRSLVSSFFDGVSRLDFRRLKHIFRLENKPIICDLHCKTCALRCCGTCNFGRLASGGPDSLVVACEINVVPVAETFPRRRPIVPTDPKTMNPCVNYELKRR
jgi:hypothetical protein